MHHCRNTIAVTFVAFVHANVTIVPPFFLCFWKILYFCEPLYGKRCRNGNCTAPEGDGSPEGRRSIATRINTKILTL